MSMTRLRQKGFTLIELIIFIVVVGVGVAGVLSIFTTAVKSSADPMVRKQTLAIAESLLEEVLLKQYTKPADSTAVAYGVSGWSRANFDTVDDYNTYTSSSIRDAAGNPIGGLEAYSVTSVVVRNPATVAECGTTTVKSVKVTISGPQGSISLTGCRGNY